MTLVWDHYPEGGGELLTALKIADHADHNGDRIYPSVAALAALTRQSERTVQYHLRAMEKRGWLVLVSGKPGTTRRYRVPVDRIPQGVESRGAKPAPPGVQRVAPVRVQTGAQGGAIAVAPESSLEATVKNKTSGEVGTSPVARCFKAYQDGLTTKYGATFPPNAKANGQLAQVVARVGAEHAEDVVRAYLASQNPYYGKIKHRLDALVKDCEQIYMELQRAAGAGAPKAPTIAQVALLAEDGRMLRRLDDRPAGDMGRIAEYSLKAYSLMISRIQPQPKYIAVRQGSERRQYSIEELQQAARAHA